ncbi:MAG: bifunctional 5,10-methylenetetrahydrofolate dehydrogenase/5,10-methenyltetrahydrofolate cyclohydrolase [Syntrophomonadaceae bacterium]|jgi:methylenetetrahydrofolate dehydrogenase (NADP+)/methenyltetrahydrofolate cyclohydrolase
MLIYGKEIREKIKQNLIKEAADIKLTLVILQIGEDPSSASYIRGILKFAGETGIMARVINFPESITEDELLMLINDLNTDPDITGIMLQTPLPSHLNTSRIINHIDYRKDVEGIHNYNLGKLLSREEGVKPATPKAVVRMLKEFNIPLEGKKITIIGRSLVVGSPLAVMLTSENATVTLCHSRTANLPGEVQNADIVVAALGKMNFVTPEMINSNSVIIDVGTNFDEYGNMVGDVDPAAKDKAYLASAVPGGVGAITVAELFDNLLTLYKQTANK